MQKEKAPAYIVAIIKSLPASRRFAAAKWAEMEYFDHLNAIVEFDSKCDEEVAKSEAWAFAAECVRRKFN
jgi:hypothetical protein